MCGCRPRLETSIFNRIGHGAFDPTLTLWTLYHTSICLSSVLMDAVFDRESIAVQGCICITV